MSANPDDFYKKEEATVKVNMGSLHVVKEGQRFKLTLFKHNGSAVKLLTVNGTVLQESLRLKRLTTEVGELKIVDVRALSALLK